LFLIAVAHNDGSDSSNIKFHETVVIVRRHPPWHALSIRHVVVILWFLHKIWLAFAVASSEVVC
jgi:hypothetical protein